MVTIPLTIPLVTTDTSSHKLPSNSCWNVCVLHKLPPIPITSPTIILNLPIKSFNPPNTVLALIQITTPILFSSITSFLSVPSLLETVMWHHLYSVFTYIHPLQTDKDLHELELIYLYFPPSFHQIVVSVL